MNLLKEILESKPYRLNDVLDKDTKEYLTKMQMISNVLCGTAALCLFIAMLTLFCAAFAPVVQ